MDLHATLGRTPTGEIAHECPTCYYAAREIHLVAGAAWPIRTRWEAKVERPCATCGTATIWCSAGDWRSAPTKKQKQ